MSRRRSPAALLPLVTSVAAALALTGCAGKAPDAGQRIEVQVAGGQITGDTGRMAVRAGTNVTLSVTSDVPDEVHVHGYDLVAALVPGTPAEITFDASVAGVFEVELHEAGTVLLTLQVQ